MTVSELHAALKEKGISEDRYFLHGLYGATDDNEKVSLTIRKGKDRIEYETYFRERGENTRSGCFLRKEQLVSIFMDY
ncbi:hypothetical protein [Niabella beijingensis]|uniref:hypothetical protein n=1 Tax=Niabella beijingensis TaxID=2872700 RepID=UPI001CC08BE0|nr:hypothetical protein [Niabella beijingensis]MBZ4191713.1 hypothetical protein [Niabella beijingensis]